MANTPATAAQINLLERVFEAFRVRYDGLKKLDPARLTVAQRNARDDLLAGGARIDATIRAMTGIQTSITKTVSGWWGEAKGLFDRAKGAVGLGALPLIYAAVAAALVLSIAAWLSSSAWSLLATTGIQKSTHETALQVYLAALETKTPSEAAQIAAGVSGALTPTDAATPEWMTLAKYGLAAFVLVNVFKIITAQGQK